MEIGLIFRHLKKKNHYYNIVKYVKIKQYAIIQLFKIIHCYMIFYPQQIFNENEEIYTIKIKLNSMQI